ncbi:hypothetical protein LJB89_03690 [Tyzzerella sp. OttesenSCG-928-J15]|nr:hypothetical protein [Tyzzerella sp. OttesenSCG-928-J15]
MNDNKHSNICYVCKLNYETDIREFVDVDGIKVKNSYGLDLFRCNFRSNSYMTIYEGKTGLALGDINDIGIISRPKDIDAYLGRKHFNGLIMHEHLKNVIHENVAQYGLSPRYTEPDVRRSARKKKEADSSVVFSKCMYFKGKKYFERISCNPFLYKRKDETLDDSCTIYTPSNGFMVPLGYRYQMAEIISRLLDGFDVHKSIEDAYNKQMTDDNMWVNLAFAEYLNCVEAAEAHNAPIRVKREKEKEEILTKRNEALQRKEQERIDKYSRILSDAVQAIISKEHVKNTSMESLSGNDSTLLNELMNRYEIRVPIKTKGWVNMALSQIMPFNDGEGYTYMYYRTSKDSTVFINYLNELVNKICEQSEIHLTEAEVKQN